jgi:hypothetical protein
MDRTLRTIQAALRLGGATLALGAVGCAESDPAVVDGGSSMLAAFPLDALVCTGPDYGTDGGGYFGQCCADVMCYAPELGTDCLPAETAQAQHFAFGSGLCNCGDTTGPYGPPTHDAGMIEGECCYAVPVIGCTGRPLSTDRGHVLAPVVSSLAWIA